MKNKIFKIINELVDKKKTNEAQIELTKLGNSFLRDPEYLYLRGKVFYLNKLYYLAIDTLLIALEFGKNDKIYNLIGDIYNILGNKELSKKILNSNLRLDAIENLKKNLSGIFRKEK